MRFSMIQSSTSPWWNDDVRSRVLRVEELWFLAIDGEVEIGAAVGVLRVVWLF